MDLLPPTVRVEDAGLRADGAPVRVVVSGLPDAAAVRNAIAKSGASVDVRAGRLEVVTTPSRLVDAAGRVGGAPLAEVLRPLLDDALEAWDGRVDDLPLPGGRVLPLSEGPVVMGIVNATPDSFSDGGVHHVDGDPSAAIAWGRELAEAGALIIDVGGESTRPGAEPVELATELERTIPVVEALASDGQVVSIDTTKAAVARAAVAAGAAIVNDVSAGAFDDEMLRTVAELGVPYVVMHLRGTPRTMQADPDFDDVVAEVFDELATSCAHAEAAGIDPSRLIVDPGIGFGKTVENNLELLRRTREFTSLGRPVLIGASRKSFIGHVGGGPEVVDRLGGSLAAAVVAITHGASIVRVHDVAETVRAIAVAAAIRSR